MSETSSQDPSGTEMTPGIAQDRLKKETVVPSDHSAETAVPRLSGEIAPSGLSADGSSDAETAVPRLSDEIVVRIARNQTSVAVSLNTKRLLEQREIER